MSSNHNHDNNVTTNSQTHDSDRDPEHDNHTVMNDPSSSSSATSAAAAGVVVAEDAHDHDHHHHHDNLRSVLYHQALETLTTVYGFDYTVSQHALNETFPLILHPSNLDDDHKHHVPTSSASTPDDTTTTTTTPTATTSTPTVVDMNKIITCAYHYMFDHQLAQDHGGPIVPLESCPHTSTNTTTTTSTTQPYIQITPSQINEIHILQQPMMISQNVCQFCQGKPKAKNTTTNPTCTSSSSSPLTITTATTSWSTSETTMKSVYDHDHEQAVSSSSPSQYQDGENWLCLTCGFIGCSRYINGHALEHWELSKTMMMTPTMMMTGSHNDSSNNNNEENISNNNNNQGHALAISLTDLSVWCYPCQAYIRPDEHPILQTIVETLQNIKFG